jgi:hypothetical protein
VRVLLAGVLGALLALVVGTGWGVATGRDLPVLHGWLQPRAYVQVDGVAVAVPRPEAAPGRLRPAVTPSGAGEHAFLHRTPEGHPVGSDPCQPVRYVVRPDGEPAEGRELVRQAARLLEDATGLVLVEVGTTDEVPAMDRTLIQPERYGPGWAPVLVAWSDEHEMPDLAGPVAGVGGSAAVPGASGHGQWLAAGRLVLDAPDIEAVIERPEGTARALAIVVHEMAHVLGLDHVEDPDELMHPLASHVTELGPGDREGLALLGQVPCEEP